MTNKPARILVPTDFSEASDQSTFLRQGDCRASGRGGPSAPRSHGIRRSKRRYRDSGRGRAPFAVSQSGAKQALKQAGANGSARTHTHIKRGLRPSRSNHRCCRRIRMRSSDHGHPWTAWFQAATRRVRRPGGRASFTGSGSHNPREIRRPVSAPLADPGSIRKSPNRALRPSDGWALSRPFWVPFSRLLHAIQPVVYPQCYALNATPDQHKEQLVLRCQEALEQVARENLTDIKFEVAVVEGHVAQSVGRYALEHDQDMIVIATRGLSGIAHTLLGSVAERLVTGAQIPVLTVR